MKKFNIAFIGLLFASLLLLSTVPTLADCGEGDPDCPLEPPQSEQVDPYLESAEGSTAEVGIPGDVNPLEITIPRLIFVDPVPLNSAGTSGAGTSSSSTETGPSEAGVSGIGGATSLVMAVVAAGAIAATAPSVLGTGKLSIIRGGGFTPTSGSVASQGAGTGGSSIMGGGQGVGASGAGGQTSWGAGRSANVSPTEGATFSRGTYGQPPKGSVYNQGILEPGASAGRRPSGVEIGGPAEAGVGGEYGLGGGKRDGEQDSVLLPRATWIPRHPPTPEPPIDPDDGNDIDELRIAGKVGSVVRGLSNAELKAQLVSTGIGAVFSPVRQAAIIGSNLIGSTARRGLTGLSDGIHYGANVLGNATERIGNKIDDGLQSVFARADGFINRRFLGPVNKWAVGELGQDFIEQGGVRGAASNLWRGAVARVKGFGQSLTQPNSTSFNAKINLAGGFGAGLSALGRLQHGRTGQQGWADAAGVGDLISGGANLVGLRGKLVTAIGGATTKQVLPTASKLTSLAQVAVKATGVLSAAVGVYTMVTEGSAFVRDLGDDGQLTKAGTLSGVKAFSGLLATFGGLALLAPPLAPVAGVALALSGILSAGTWVAENWDRFKPGLQAWKGVGENAKTIVRTAATRAVTSIRDRVTRTAITVRDVVQNTTSRVVSTLSQTVQSVSSTVSNAVDNAVDKAKSFFGNLFGSSTDQTPAPSPKPTPPRSSSTPSPRQINQTKTSRPTVRRRTSSKTNKLRRKRRTSRTEQQRKAYRLIKGR